MDSGQGDFSTRKPRGREAPGKMKEQSNMKLACQSCGAVFAIDGACPRCGARPTTEGGVYGFDDKNFFYGAPSKTAIRNALAVREEVSPLVALDVYDHREEPRRHIGRYLGDPRRVAPLACLSREALKSAVVLDYGCGLGVFTTMLAAQCRRVCAVDATRERAEFTRAMARHLKDQNVVVAKGALDSPLFFADAQFDLVILNGVLEWTPVTMDQRQHPREVLVRFLDRVQKLLKPGGLIYVGIEHRYNLDYFLGLPDHHSGLLFGSLLPRWMANLYSKGVHHTPYRARTYSHRAYRRIFRDAGLKMLADNFLYPNYQFPKYIGEVSAYGRFYRKEICKGSAPGRRMKLIRALGRIPGSAAVFKRTPPAYGFYLGADASGDLLAARPEYDYLSQDGLVQGWRNGKRRYTRLPSRTWMMPPGAFDVQRTVKDRLNEEGRPDLARRIPAIQRVNGEWEEEILPGRPMAEDLLQFQRGSTPAGFEGLYRDAMRKVCEMYDLLREPESMAFARYACDWLERQLAPYRFSETISLLDGLNDAVRDAPMDLPIHRSPVHGNVSPRNMLCHEGECTALIDWALAESRGACEIDLLDGLYCYHRYVLGRLPEVPGFFAGFRRLHESFASCLSVAPPASPNHAVYLFVAVRNTVVRGRGCYFDQKEFEQLLADWRGYDVSEL